MIPYCSVVYGTKNKASLNQLMSLVGLYCMFSSVDSQARYGQCEAFEHVKPNTVFMNMGRGPVVDEIALIQALRTDGSRGGFGRLCPRALAGQ
jgi:hypothetical protein